MSSAGTQSAADAPERLHATSLRLHCKLWKDTGHNFNRLRDLLMPDASQPRLSHNIAVTKAATQKEVCLHDVDRGMQLMEGIQVRRRLTATVEYHIASGIAPSSCKQAWQLSFVSTWAWE